jgi:hypothetical protein
MRAHADNLFWRHHIHNAPDRRGDIGVAARGAGTAAADAGGRVSAQHDVRRLGSPRGGVSPGPQEASWSRVSTARSKTAGPGINRRWSPICRAGAPGSGASGGRREAHSMRDSAQVTAPGAVTSMIVAVSTRPNRQNRSPCSRMSVPLVQNQMLRLVVSVGGIGAAKSRRVHVRIARMVTAIARTIPKANASLACSGFGAMSPLVARSHYAGL